MCALPYKTAGETNFCVSLTRHCLNGVWMTFVCHRRILNQRVEGSIPSGGTEWASHPLAVTGLADATSCSSSVSVAACAVLRSFTLSCDTRSCATSAPGVAPLCWPRQLPAENGSPSSSGNARSRRRPYSPASQQRRAVENRCLVRSVGLLSRYEIAEAIFRPLHAV